MVSLGCGGPRQPRDHRRETLVITGASCPSELKVDGDGIVWLERARRADGWFEGPPAVMTLPAEEHTPSLLASLEPGCAWLAIDPHAAYVTCWPDNSPSARVVALPRAGGARRVVLDAPVPFGVTSHDQALYWIAGGEVRSVSATGGAVRVRVEQTDISGFALRDNELYWVTGASDDGTEVPSLWTAPVDGGRPRRLAMFDEEFPQIAGIDEDHVVVIVPTPPEGERLFLVERDSGASQRIWVDRGREVRVYRGRLFIHTQRVDGQLSPSREGIFQAAIDAHPAREVIAAFPEADHVVSFDVTADHLYVVVRRSRECEIVRYRL